MAPVTIEQAGINALAAWLTSRMPAFNAKTGEGVRVSARWPNPDQKLPPRAVTIIRAGDPKQESSQPALVGHEIIHSDVTARIIVATVVDLATSIAALNTCRTSYESSHRTSLAAHQAADATNAITAPAASDQPSALTLANDLRNKVAAHLGSAAHANPDTVNALAAQPLATDLASLIALTKIIVSTLNGHYVARVYIWRLADIEQPVQLDIWTTHEADRDELLARLEPLLNADPSLSAGFTNADPVREGTIVALGDGWAGYADFDFDAPRLEQQDDDVKRGEYRATYRGTMSLWRLVKAQSPRMTRIQLQNTVGGKTSTATVAWAPGGSTSESYT